MNSKQKIIKPIFKWAGGKRQLLKYFTNIIPNSYNKYIEPFFGGGALFFFLKPSNAVIADSNEDLMIAYKTLVSQSQDVVEILKTYSNSKEFYYTIREQEPSDNVLKTARILYLNRTCFNGLYRVNKKGQFNVPYGYYKNPKFLDEENLINVIDLLKNANIVTSDYQNILKKYPEANDLVYLDPPYFPVGKYSDFKRYTKEQFYMEDHVNLAKWYKILDGKGCKVILTNSDSEEILNLYKDYKIKILDTKRNINCHGTGRIGRDIIVTNF